MSVTYLFINIIVTFTKIYYSNQVKTEEKSGLQEDRYIRAEEFSYQSQGRNITTPISINAVASVAAEHPAPVVSNVLPPPVWWVCFTSLRFTSSGIPAEANKKTQDNAWPAPHDVSRTALKPKMLAPLFYPSLPHMFP